LSIKLEFDEVYEYDTLKSDMTVPVIIGSRGREVIFTARLDTGSSHCIFERKHGEQLGLEIEAGVPISFSTATGGFHAFGHELTMVDSTSKRFRQFISLRVMTSTGMSSAESAGLTVLNVG
jgi:hypothetical protein